MISRNEPQTTTNNHKSLDLTRRPTTSKQITTSQPWNGWRLVHSKNSVWSSPWKSPCANSIGKFFLWLIVFFLGNFRPRLARLYLYEVMILQLTITRNRIWRRYSRETAGKGSCGKLNKDEQSKWPVSHSWWILQNVLWYDVLSCLLCITWTV